MTTYCLEMRSTANWDDVRYREYTSSAKKAELFKQVPRIRFTDSAHHIVPVVNEHRGPKKPRNMLLQDHVVDAIVAINKAVPKSPKWTLLDDCRALLEALDHTLSVHGKVDAGTPLHERLRRTLELIQDVK